MPWRDMDLPEDDATQFGMESIGRQLVRLRHRAGLTQRQLEATSGVQQAVISRLENGKQHGISWWRFARLVGTLGGVDPPPQPPKPPWPGQSHLVADPYTPQLEDLEPLEMSTPHPPTSLDAADSYRD